MADENTENTASPPPPPPPPEPQQQSYPQYAPSPRRSLFETLTSQKLLAWLVFIGLILVMLGAVMVDAAPNITNYNSRNKPKNADQMTDDQATENAIRYSGNVINDLGMFLVVMALLLAALLRTDLSDTVRFGLLLAIGLIFLGSGI